MKTFPRILSGGLSAALLTGFLATGAGAVSFEKTQTYFPGRFTDVTAGAWYEPYVKSVYELGLMNGNSATTFSPTGGFTLAEAATIAAKLHAACFGLEITPAQSGPWYQSAVDYCILNDIFKADRFSDYTRAATRAEMAEFLVAALPANEWTPKNSVTALPDVTVQDPYGAAVFSLYNAGVLSGSDLYGSFHPKDGITRAEVAAIVSRCAHPEERLTLALQPLPAPVDPAPTDLASALDSFIAKTPLYQNEPFGCGFFYDMDGDGTDEMVLLGYRKNVGDGLPGYVYSLYDNENGTVVTRVDQEPIAHAQNDTLVTVGVTSRNGLPQLTARALFESDDLVHTSKTYKFHAHKTAQLESVFEMRCLNYGGMEEFEAITQNGAPIGYYDFQRLTNCSFSVRCDIGSLYDQGEMTFAQMKEKLQHKTFSVEELAQMTNAYLDANFNSASRSYHVSSYECTQNGLKYSFMVRLSRHDAPSTASANVLSGTFTLDARTMTGTIEWNDGSTHSVDLNRM